MGALPAGVSANHILYIRNLRPIISTRFQLTKRVDVIGQFASWQQQNLLQSLSYFWDFWIEKSDSGEAIKRVVERIRSKKPSRFLISNMTIRSSNFCYHKIFLKDVNTLDRFTFFFLFISFSHRSLECRRLDFLPTEIRCLATQEKRMRCLNSKSEWAAVDLQIPRRQVSIGLNNFEFLD